MIGKMREEIKDIRNYKQALIEEGQNSRSPKMEDLSNKGMTYKAEVKRPAIKMKQSSPIIGQSCSTKSPNSYQEISRRKLGKYNAKTSTSPNTKLKGESASPVNHKGTWQGLENITEIPHKIANIVAGEKYHTEEFDPGKLINDEEEDPEYIEIMKKLHGKRASEGGFEGKLAKMNKKSSLPDFPAFG